MKNNISQMLYLGCFYMHRFYLHNYYALKIIIIVKLLKCEYVRCRKTDRQRNNGHASNMWSIFGERG